MRRCFGSNLTRSLRTGERWRADRQSARSCLPPNGTLKVSKANANIDLSTPEVMLLRKLVHPGVAEVLDAGCHQ